MIDQAHSSSLQNHTPDKYSTHASFVYSSKFTTPVLQLLNAQPGERITDLGCGTGELTEIIRNQVGEKGEVWAVDSSDSMLHKASERLGKGRVTLINGDIQTISNSLDPTLAGTFDAVFSSATFHWCKVNPGGVIDGVRWLLKPGGRLAFEMGGFGNTVGVRGAIHEVLRKHGIDPIPLDPWYFPNVAQYSSLLELHGMIPGDIQLVPRPSPLTTDLRGWLETFVRNTFFSAVNDEDADQYLSEVVDICRPDAYWSLQDPGMGVQRESACSHANPSSHGWEVMYVRLRGVATRGS